MRPIRFLIALGAIGLLLTAAPDLGWARKGHRAKKAKQTRFYDFDDLLIDGEFRKPATLYTRALKSPRFDRLLRLQKSFLDQLSQTVRYPSLRWLR